MVVISSPVPGRLQSVLKHYTEHTFICAGDTQVEVCRSTVRCALPAQKEEKQQILKEQLASLSYKLQRITALFFS